jgi:hypothetical protein
MVEQFLQARTFQLLVRKMEEARNGAGGEVFRDDGWCQTKEY